MKTKTHSLVALAGCLAQALLPSPSLGGTPGGPVQLRPIVRHAMKVDVSPSLRSLVSLAPWPGNPREIPIHSLVDPYQATAASPEFRGADPALQTTLPTASMPDPLQDFEGINNVNGVLPPDTNGDVGPDHYVEWVNLSFAVFDKTGTLLFGPVAGNSLWTRFGAPCETHNDGDPIVKYDRLADRWLMSQFALTSFGFYQCIAVSQTGDPTASFNRYAFLISLTKLNDYPKFGIWTDAYYMSTNQFGASGYAGQGVLAFERDKMLAGDPSARMVYFDLFSIDPSLGGMLPSDFEGPPPPEGSPNYFVEVDFPQRYPTDRDILQVFQFHVDWTDPSSSTFTGPTVLQTDPFNPNLCNFRNCVPQPSTPLKLEALSDRLMYRLEYRNFDDHESLVANHTVNVGSDQAGIRWYELRKTGNSDWEVFQQGTYAPDADSRWMGSVAMDGAGNMALGFSVSSNSTYPSVRYAGRLASDPLGTLGQGEATLIDGGGSQTHGSGRWGDYSMMAVDPTDDCTFWYTQQYYATTSAADWQTRIGSFQFPGCAAEVRARRFAPRTQQLR